MTPFHTCYFERCLPILSVSSVGLIRPYGIQTRGRIACTECKDAAYCYGCSAVCVLVYHSLRWT